MTYWARSANREGIKQSQKEHLVAVQERATCFAKVMGLQDEARVAGLLHDIGKYGGLFQDVLDGREHGIDHSSMGASIAWKECGAWYAALVIAAHHAGLGRSSRDEFINPLRPRDLIERGARLSEPNPDVLIQRFEQDGFSLPPSDLCLVRTPPEGAARMLDVRMLLSALVDADYLSAEEHEAGSRWRRPVGVDLRPGRVAQVLTEHIKGVRHHSAASEAIRRMRDDLLDACLVSADAKAGLFTLSAPTGAGKTLAMLGFAARHAERNGLRRIVVVIPYLSIIEQNARVYREILEPVFGRRYLIEDHGLARGARVRHKGCEPLDESAALSLLAENWDAPLIVTTSVQFLESLCAAKASACRKLHRLAKSVILFDEVQTLPPRLASATLAALAHLSSRYGSSVVFSTATQPAFTHIDASVRMLSFGEPGWAPVEIAPGSRSLFQSAKRSRRTEVRWPQHEKIPWDELASELAGPEHGQVLCIVNLKRHARKLVEHLRGLHAKGVCHLSTSMCPAHRKAVLARARLRLSRGHPCRLISTQCVEAGVDISAPEVYRALADVVAVAQAAGRCNREGRQANGLVRVFVPEDEGYPDQDYERAAKLTLQILDTRGPERMDIYDPSLFEEFYRTLFSLTGVHDSGKAAELREAVLDGRFDEVAKLYKLINEDTISVLVPYAPMLAKFDALAVEARKNGLTADWMRRAAHLTVPLYRPQRQAAIWERLERIPVSRNAESDDWFVYRQPAGVTEYDPILGLIPPDAQALWIG